MNDSVSILIPTHNRGEILDRTLRSLAEMAYPAGVAVEVVVVANACTDDTERRVMGFAGGLPGLKCVAEPTPGLGHARNRAVRSSRNAICALLDDDVWVSKGWLAGLLETYRTTPAGMVAGRIELWWEAVERPAWLTSGMESTLSCLDFGERTIEMDRLEAVGANFSFRREVFDRVGPFRTDLDRVGDQLLGGGETFLVREAAKSGFRLFYSPAASIKHWVAPHRVEVPYLTGVARGTAFSIVRMKDRFGPLDAARALALGGARLIGYSALAPLARAAGGEGWHVRALVRRAIGQGQFLGAVARMKHGPLEPQPPHHPQHPGVITAP